MVDISGDTAHLSSLFGDDTLCSFQKSSLNMHRSSSDFLVPGPSSRCASSPSQGSSSPESSFNDHVHKSEFSLLISDSCSNIDISLPAQSAVRSYHDKSCCSVREEISETTQNNEREQTLELDLRSACANALSLCAFTFKEDGIDDDSSRYLSFAIYVQIKH